MICRMFGATELSAMKEDVDILLSQFVKGCLNPIYETACDLSTGFRDMKMYITLLYKCTYKYVHT